MKAICKSAIIIFMVAGLFMVAHAQSDDAPSTKIDEAVRAQMAEQKIPGVSLAVVRNGKIVKAEGYGLANVELNIPVTPQSVFHTESVAKTFTATAVMMLVEEGKIGLDEKISKYLPEAPPAWNEVTIRRLLSHTSGIRDYDGVDGDPIYDFHHDMTEEDLLRKFASESMKFPPGEKRSYSNSGYVILGAMIHRVTGMLWSDFVQERIFTPLGMTSTRLISNEDIIPNRVSGYVNTNGQWKNEPYISTSFRKSADGEFYTNVFDMAKWDAALNTEKLLKRSTLEQMWTLVKLNNGTPTAYNGLGWFVATVNGHRLIWHDGVGEAFTTGFYRYVDDDFSIIVLTNLGEDDEAAMPKRIADSVAAIYVPALNIAENKANLNADAAIIDEREKDVSTLERIIDASLKALSGPVGAPRDWARYQNLFDPAARLVSASIDDKGKTVITRWSLESYKADANDYLVKTGFDDQKLACIPTSFGNVATVRCSFEGLEQTKVVERGVAMYQLYNDGKRWWITSVVWDRERPGNLIPSELLPAK